MSNLIKISDKGLVSAKELYLGLGLDKSHWSRWYPKNIQENGFFEEDVDWSQVRHDGEGNETIDFAITIEFAKHIAMMARTEKSHKYRNYFIQCENKLKENKPKCIEDVLIQSLQEMKEMRLQIQEAKSQTVAVKEEVQAIRDVITINPKEQWRKQTNSILNSVGYKTGEYNKIKEKAYAALEERGKCKLKIRLENLQGRALRQGMAQSNVDKLNHLDVIANDIRLKEIYIAIVKEIAIKNGIKIN